VPGFNITHEALRNTEELLKRDNRRNDREMLQRVKAALNPISTSGQVLSSINENRIPGLGAWLEAKLRSWWEGSEPILWLHGGPGVGKSFITSKIITELSKEGFSAAPTPIVASFFCRNNGVDLGSLNNGRGATRGLCSARGRDLSERGPCRQLCRVAKSAGQLPHQGAS
jgi:hypothetical protein